MIEIRSYIPKPEKKVGPPTKYPFEKMSVGDSFIYKIKPGEDLRIIQRSIHSTAKQRGFEITTRSTKDTVTVWLEAVIED